MYKSNVKRPNTCDCIIKRIVRGLLDIDSYLYEATYDLILTCRNLPIGIQLREFLRIVFLMSLRITKNEN